jgi:serine/threonine protein kinase
MDKWSIVDNGNLEINNRPFAIKPLKIVKKIGAGANGVVFECENTILKRKEALKIWLKLRLNDTRDKTHQGQLEAIKAATALGSTPTIFYGGVQDGYFFTSMEYVSGQTLKNYLRSRSLTLTLLEKHTLAREYIELMFSFNDLIHGDPHDGNIIIKDNGGMVLLDFGTSVLMGEEQCERRHWKIVEEVFSKIMNPFNFLKIMHATYPIPPRDLDPYFDFMENFFDMLWFIGLRPKGRGMNIFYEEQERDLAILDSNMRKALEGLKNQHSDYFSDEKNLGFPWFY